jgi:lysyl-tRNA synthetase class 2
MLIGPFSANQLLHYRALASAAIRRLFEERGAIEVRTPMLSTFPDLAPVHQFVSQHPRSRETYCLRIAPEEHLTRLIGLGVPAVYEIATNFRCEIVDATHLIEFESIEALFTEASVVDMIDLMEAACRAIASVGAATTGNDRRPFPSGKFPRIPVPDWIEAELGLDADSLISIVGLRQVAARLGCVDERSESMSQLMDRIIGAIADVIGGAVFVGIFPAFLGGPAARDAKRPAFISRYELYYNGLELGSAAQQLRDVNEWRAHYDRNMQLKKELNIEPNLVNRELLNDISVLPEFAGLGLGFERVLAISAGLDDVRKVRLFSN